MVSQGTGSLPAGSHELPDRLSHTHLAVVFLQEILGGVVSQGPRRLN